MNRDEQIRAAVELLTPRAQDKDACRQEIVEALNLMRSAADTAAFNKRVSATKALQRNYHSCLERLIYWSEQLMSVRPQAPRGWRPPLDPAVLQDILRKSRQSTQAYKVASTVRLPQERAVGLAHLLAKRWRGDKALGLSRRSVWWKLSTVLLGKRRGEPGGDLLHHMQKFHHRRHPRKRTRR
jgi:hypothetical protein